MTYDKRHGGPYDRGSADAYYRRSPRPHYFVGGTYLSPEITDLTEEEKRAYMAGYADAEALGDFKDWGDYDRDDDRYDNVDGEDEEKDD